MSRMNTLGANDYSPLCEHESESGKDQTMPAESEPELFKDVAVLLKQMIGIADNSLPYFEKFTRGVEKGQITDISQIEHTLDSMVSYCFDDRALLLYKRVMRAIMQKHPETVKAYVTLYYEMYENCCDADVKAI